MAIVGPFCVRPVFRLACGLNLAIAVFALPAR